MRLSARVKEPILARVKNLRRSVLLLQVDLAAAKPAEEPRTLTLSPLNARTYPQLQSTLEREAPERIGSMAFRLHQKAEGFIAMMENRPIGYVFYVAGSSDPEAVVHGDLRWLDMHPSHDELYVFDYFVFPSQRGAGLRFVRSVQEAHAKMGYTKAYGYVFQDNRAALMTYRMTGWKQIGEVEELRLGSRWVIVGRTLYRMEAFCRYPQVRL
jgi:GNAT superfamily N-acetyltransferase